MNLSKILKRIKYKLLGNPSPSNKRLNKLFDNVNKIIIKKGGVRDEKALSNEILLIITDKNKLTQFQNLLEIVEPSLDGFCCCEGDYGIELISNDKIQTTIGFHHGIALRYEYWNSDVALAKKMDLLQFLSQEGLTEPLSNYLNQND